MTQAALFLVILTSLVLDLLCVLVEEKVIFSVERDSQLSGLSTDQPLCSASPCTGTRLKCAFLCAQDSSCHSFSYRTGTSTCWKNSGSIYSWGATGLTVSAGLNYIGRPMQDITDGDWVLAFRGQAHNGDGNIQTLWTTTGVHSDEDMWNLDFDTVSKVGVANSAHYRSRWLDLWGSLDIDQVKFALYKGGTEVVTMIFNGSGSDNENWFSHDRLISSSYTDLVGTSGIQNFSIEGQIFRQFYVSLESNFFKCDGQHWVMLQFASDNTCAWTSTGPMPEFLYSTGGTVSDFNSGDYDTADVMAVFLKFNV